jgi:hypothetical protein
MPLSTDTAAAMHRDREQSSDRGQRQIRLFCVSTAKYLSPLVAS